MRNQLATLHDMRTLQKPCGLCAELHVPAVKCNFRALATRVTKLLEANALIPQILTAQKEATVTAQYFQQILKKADQSHTILLEVLAEYEYTGEEIKNKYLERLDEWAKGNLSLDTSEQQDLFSQESSTPNGKDGKLSTMMGPGEAFRLDT